MSVDFSLDEERIEHLETSEGIVVPLAALNKGRRKHFDLCDAAGKAIPVLGTEANGFLTEIALVSEAWTLIETNEIVPSDTQRDDIIQELRGIVSGNVYESRDALSRISKFAESEDHFRVLWENDPYRKLLLRLSENYVLFAVVDESFLGRHIVKFGYADESLLRRPPLAAAIATGIRSLLAEFKREAPKILDSMVRRGPFAPLSKALSDFKTASRELWPEAVKFFKAPDGKEFEVFLTCPDWSLSYHLEIVLPEELRAQWATFVDVEKGIALTEAGDELDVNRASLHANRSLLESFDVSAYLELIPERRGQILQGLFFGVVTSVTLLLGLIEGVNTITEGDATVAILLAGAAAVSVYGAIRGEHVLVTTIFYGPRRAAFFVAIAAAAGSISLATNGPINPEVVWWPAFAVSLLATLRLAISAVRAAGYALRTPS